MAHDTVSHARPLLDITDVFQLQQSALMPDIDILDILLGEDLRVEMDAVPVYTAYHAKGFKYDIIIVDGFLHVLQRDA